MRCCSSLLCLLLVWTASSCSDPPSSKASAGDHGAVEPETRVKEDLTPTDAPASNDLPTPGDLTEPDDPLAPEDAGSEDLDPPADTGSEDLEPPEDLDPPADLDPPEDLSPPEDIDPPEDLSLPEDIDPPEDLSPPTDVGPECAIDPPLEPTSLLLTLIPDPGEVVAGSGLVTKMEPYCCDADWQWQLEITLDAGAIVDARMKLPIESPLPLQVGDPVSVFADHILPTQQSLFVRHADGTPAFVFYNGDAPKDAFAGCGGVAGCPDLIQLESSCPPIAGECGLEKSPPIQLVLAGETFNLLQGEITEADDETVALAARSLEYVPPITCAEAPSHWLRVVALGPPHLSCNTGKIGFGQSNTMSFEFYELCVDAKSGPKEYLAALQAIDSSLYCGVGGVFAKCKGEDIACHGDLEKAGMGPALSDAKWAQLCALSALPWMSKLVGGHYL